MHYDVHEGTINVPISISSAGDNILVAGNPNRWIYVHEIIGSPVGAVTLQVKDGTTVLGNYALTAGQGITEDDVAGNSASPRFKIKPGNNLILNLSTGTTFTGALQYSFRY